MSLNFRKSTLIFASYIIISASFMRQVLNFLIKNMGKDGVAITLLCLFFLGLAFALLYLCRMGPSFFKIFSFILVFALGLIYFQGIEIVEERWHLIMFGLLGWLATKDMRREEKIIKSIVTSFLFCFLIGALDEIFQWWLPYRVGEVRDVLFAAIGGAWGISLFLIASFMPSQKMVKCMLIILLVIFLIPTARIVLTIATPYNFSESIYWLKKSVVGLSNENQGIVKNIPDSYILNKGIEPKYTLTFIGDLMPTQDQYVDIGSQLKEFLSNSDFLIANLEGIITQERKNSLVLVSDRRHSEEIIEILKDLFPPEKTYISVSNNHAGDFGEKEFFKSVKVLNQQGFNVFGWQDQAFFDINSDIRLISGTAWSNRESDYVFRLKSAKAQIKPESFNFLYPHFGYEFELYPRPEIVKAGKEMIKTFDAVIGHHSHCPQPVSIESVGKINKLLAYSLGDFLSVRKAKRYQYGIILKAQLGQNKDSQWVLGRIEKRLIKCAPSSDGNFIVDLSSDSLN